MNVFKGARGTEARQMNSSFFRASHLSNIANVAYENCKLLVQYEIPVALHCHDMNHLMSQPEWDDLDLDSRDFPDENNFFDNNATLGDYQRPDWFHSGALFSQIILMEREDYLEAASRRATDFDSFLFSTLLPQLRSLPEPVFRLVKSLSYQFGPALIRVWGRLTNKRRISGAAELPRSAEVIEEQSSKYGDNWTIRKSDMAAYGFHSRWAQLATENSDVVYAYALSPIYMMLNRNKPYVAVEIGTMRDIPFEGSARGRLLAHAYRESDYVLITNPDVRARAIELGLERYSFCPHPIDEDRYKPADEDEREDFRKSLFGVSDNETMVVFAPARQNWAIKGNDKYLRAVSRCLKEGMKLKLVITGWGQEVERSKALCAELGIEKSVMWVRPVSEGGLIKYFSSADCVIDQFELGVFGLITPKAMSCGAPVITSYDESLNEWCFDQPPPVLASTTCDDIATHLGRLYRHPEVRLSVARASRQWVLDHHSKARVVQTLLNAGELAKTHFHETQEAAE